jgi:hypothetical protein
MAGFKQPDFIERQAAAAKARKAALEKFLAKAADPALAERLTERTASAAGRKAVRNVRQAEKAEKKVRDAEHAERTKREAALQAERDKIASAERERGLQAESKAARDARYAARKSRKKRK